MSLRKVRSRRGTVVVLAAFLMVALVGMVAFAVDIGYITLTKAEVQNAADSAARGCGRAAQDAGGDPAPRRGLMPRATWRRPSRSSLLTRTLNLETGIWTRRCSRLAATLATRCALTVRRPGAPHFFGKIFGRHNFDVEASSIAMANPCDIVFVVDLSGSMNDDSEPCWATTAINTEFGPLGFGSLGEDVVQQLYDDFGFGTFPGTEQYIGQPLAVAQNSTAYNNLTKNGGKLMRRFDTTDVPDH